MPDPRGFGDLVGEGRNRIAYLSPSGKTVLKVPKNEAGRIDNLVEHLRYTNYRKNGIYAPCRFLPGTDILVMEFVSQINWYDIPDNEWPDWLHNIDCAQAGINKSGRILAFDYA